VESVLNDNAAQVLLGSVFTHGDARRAGVSDRRLYAWRDSGSLVVLGAGLYRWADAEPANLDLIEIAERVPQATLCLETALAHHGLTDAIPMATDVAIPRGSHRPTLSAATRLHYFHRENFFVGRVELDVAARVPLGIYSPERCIIDVVRLRHEQGADVAWGALRKWLVQPGRSPGGLVNMATKFRGAETPIRAALEVLL
jgi:hypothetical protein